ncbi:MAG: YlxR family protein [Candidatus Binataceae bacterium]|nr:YlxR family protein [Candidatus Binataceae bacterium]
MRTCLGCRARDDKQTMVRIVIVGKVVEPDFAQVMPGRGGYLHRRAGCLDRFLVSRVKEFRSLRAAITAENRSQIVKSIRTRLDSSDSVA